MARFDCCKNCKPPKRSAGCHSTCKEYLADKAEYDDERARVRQIMAAEDDYIGFATRMHDAIKRRRRR